jgi:hypothetical protein
MDKPTKITFGEMRDMGVRGVLISRNRTGASRSRACSKLPLQARIYRPVKRQDFGNECSLCNLAPTRGVLRGE